MIGLTKAVGYSMVTQARKRTMAILTD